MTYNIFIEGIPGSGKTTALNNLSKVLPDYKAYHEGDVSPVELAWCAYMNAEEYNKAQKDYPRQRDELITRTVCEDSYYIVPYTKIKTEDRSFYSYMEKYEIYGGRKSVDDFIGITLHRFNRFRVNMCFHGNANIFECAFFQNIIEELMLFACFDDKCITEFYKRLIAVVDMTRFKLIRLIPRDIKESLLHIKAERVDSTGNEVWYAAMMDYLKNSPYGKVKGYSTFDDMLTHFKRRIELEDRITNLLPAKSYISLESKSDGLEQKLLEFLAVTR